MPHRAPKASLAITLFAVGSLLAEHPRYARTSGLALGTYSAPPAPGVGLQIDLLLPTDETLTMRGRLIGARTTVDGGTVWRWNVRFEDLTAEVRDALTRYIHRAQT